MSKTSIIAVIVALGFFVALAVFNASSPDEVVVSKPWNEAMVNGSLDAPNKIVEYGDYFCQYCTMFHEQVSSKEFIDEYLDTNKVSVETRPITVLSGPYSPNTQQGTEAAFCAADQNKFTAFSNDIIPRIKEDFFDKGIGVKASNGVAIAEPKPIALLPQSYFDSSAVEAGLDVDQFRGCMEDKKFASEIKSYTDRAIAKGVQRLPHIVVNNYVSSGFGGGWDNFQLMLKAGKVK